MGAWTEGSRIAIQLPGGAPVLSGTGRSQHWERSLQAGKEKKDIHCFNPWETTIHRLAKSRLIRKAPDAWKDWPRKKGEAEDGMVGWHHWFNGHKLEQTLGDGEGQGSLMCCSPWGQSDTTEKQGVWNDDALRQKLITSKENQMNRKNEKRKELWRKGGEQNSTPTKQHSSTQYLPEQRTLFSALENKTDDLTKTQDL